MTTNEKLMKTILELVDNFADMKDEVGMCQLNLAANLLQPEVTETLKDKWHFVEDNDLFEGWQILPLIYGTIENNYE